MSLINTHRRLLATSRLDVLDQHAPEIVGNITIREPTPWTNADIKKPKIEKRKAEKKWKKTRSLLDLNTYKEKRNLFNSLLNDLKAKDLSNKIKQNKENSKAMFKVINSSLNRKQESPLPDHNNETELANEFITFF